MVGKPKLPNWLKFIRSHRKIYITLGRGERRTYIEKLAEETKLSDNSLRRMLAAAGFLEEEGIVDLPPGGRLPLGSVENIARIAAYDPSRRRVLLDEVWAGTKTIDELATEWETLRDKVRSNAKKKSAISTERLKDMATAELKRQKFDVGHAKFVSFDKDKDALHLSRYFDGVSGPRLVINLRKGPPVVVFDSRRFGGTAASFMHMRKEFLRNILVAAGLYQTVLVHAPEWDEDIVELKRLARPSVVSRILLIGHPDSSENQG